jgi:hypothetical protein
MEIKKEILTATGAAALLLLAQSAQATPVLVGTVNGCYDCHVYDTPSIEITNLDSTYSFTNVVLKLTGYQGQNDGLVQSRNLPDVAPGTTEIYTWSEGFATQGNLFTYDYDDSGLNPGPSQCNFPGTPINSSLCADVGNFYVTLTALFNGQPVYSQFGPDPCQPSGLAPFNTCEGNVPGVFIGWEGLDENGYSENPLYDVHVNGGPNGVLANIYIGTPPTAVPEPATVSLLVLGGIGLLRKRVLRS